MRISEVRYNAIKSYLELENSDPENTDAFWDTPESKEFAVESGHGESGLESSAVSAVRGRRRRFKLLISENNLILKDGQVGAYVPVGSANFKTLLNEAQYGEVMKQYHNKRGHIGVTPTYKEMKKDFLFVNIDEVRDYISHCEQCQGTRLNKPLKTPVKKPVKTPVKTQAKTPRKEHVNIPEKTLVKSPQKTLVKKTVKTPEKTPVKETVKTPEKTPTESLEVKNQDPRYKNIKMATFPSKSLKLKLPTSNEKFQALRSKDVLCDVTIQLERTEIVGESKEEVKIVEEVNAHKLILCANSSFGTDIWNPHKVTIFIKAQDSRLEELKAIVDFLYGETLILTAENQKSTKEIADGLMLEELVYICDNTIFTENSYRTLECGVDIILDHPLVSPMVKVKKEPGLQQSFDEEDEDSDIEEFQPPLKKTKSGRAVKLTLKAKALTRKRKVATKSSETPVSHKSPAKVSDGPDTPKSPAKVSDGPDTPKSPTKVSDGPNTPKSTTNVSDDTGTPTTPAQVPDSAGEPDQAEAVTPDKFDDTQEVTPSTPADEAVETPQKSEQTQDVTISKPKKMPDALDLSCPREDCNFIGANRAVWRDHMIFSHSEFYWFKCKLCDDKGDDSKLTYKWPPGARKHRQLAHRGKEMNAVFNFQCGICKIPMTFYRQLQVHIQQKHGVKSVYVKERGTYPRQTDVNVDEDSDGTETDSGTSKRKTSRKRKSTQKASKSKRNKDNEQENIKDADQLEIDDKKQVYKCPECDIRMKGRSAFQNHKIFSHSKSYWYSCTLCEDPENEGRHKYKSKSAMYLHYRKHHQAEYPKLEDTLKIQCGICETPMENTTALKDHIKENHYLKVEDWKECTSEDLFPDDQAYRKATKEIGTVDADNIPKGPKKCDICLKTYSHYTYWYKHMSQKHAEDLNNLIDLGMVTIIPLYNQVCEYCGNSFMSQTKLNEHMLIHTGRPKLKCRYCPKEFTIRSTRMRHEAKHLGVKKHVCEICGKRFIHTDGLRSHLQVHNKNKPLYQCPVCNVMLKTQAGFQNHMKRHDGVKRQRCRFCPAVFLERAECHNHESTVHIDEAPYACKICGRNYKTHSGLSQHMGGSHNEGIRYQCNMCDKDYLQPRLLNEHKKKQHQINAYRFKCGRCDTHFARESQLLSHSERCIKLPFVNSADKDKQFQLHPVNNEGVYELVVNDGKFTNFLVQHNSEGVLQQVVLDSNTQQQQTFEVSIVEEQPDGTTITETQKEMSLEDFENMVPEGATLQKKDGMYYVILADNDESPSDVAQIINEKLTAGDNKEANLNEGKVVSNDVNVVREGNVNKGEIKVMQDVYAAESIPWRVNANEGQEVVYAMKPNSNETQDIVYNVKLSDNTGQGIVYAMEQNVMHDQVNANDGQTSSNVEQQIVYTVQQNFIDDQATAIDGQTNAGEGQENAGGGQENANGGHANTDEGQVIANEGEGIAVEGQANA
ncbi:unnamed protein product, partial [Owenia fusiformis]